MNEADWCPQPDTAARVDNVPREWSIVDKLEKVVNLALGANNSDFGKDLPSFTDDVHMLASRDFVAAISEAFRGSIVEVGEFY